MAKSKMRCDPVRWPWVNFSCPLYQTKIWPLALTANRLWRPAMAMRSNYGLRHICSHVGIIGGHRGHNRAHVRAGTDAPRIFAIVDFGHFGRIGHVGVADPAVAYFDCLWRGHGTIHRASVCGGHFARSDVGGAVCGLCRSAGPAQSRTISRGWRPPAAARKIGGVTAVDPCHAVDCGGDWNDLHRRCIAHGRGRNRGCVVVGLGRQFGRLWLVCPVAGGGH